MESSSQKKEWTYRDFDDLPPESRYEIIHNTLVEEPSPGPYHQRVSKKLEIHLDNFVGERLLGEIFNAPLDVVLDENNVVQPYLFLISSGQEHIVGNKNISGAPSLVIEILSPASIKNDRFEKLSLYENFGIKEYWIVDPANRSIEIYILKNNDYELYSFASEQGTVKSRLLDGFVLDIGLIFY